MTTVVMLFLLLLSSSILGLTSGSNKTPLRIGYISAITGGFISNGGIPAIDMALSQINNHTEILQNYTLERTQVYDSNCDRTVSLDAFFELIESQPTIVTLLGCGCSTATIPVAEISHHWNIPQLAFASTAYVLNDRRRFRNFFRPMTTQEFVAVSLVQLMKEFGWTQMAVITQNENLFKGITDTLKSIGERNGKMIDTSITIESSVNPFPNDLIFNSLEAGHQHRIIYINMYPNFAYHIYCEAYRRGIYYPKYVFILNLWYNDEWWINNAPTDSSMTCTPSQLMRAINGTIGVSPDGYFIMDNQTMRTFSGLTPQEFTEQYCSLFQLPEYRNFTIFSLVGLAYDGAWAVAIGLDIATRRIAAGNDSGCEELSGDLVPLEYFNYTNEKLGCIMRQSMHQVQFLGLTGHITFNENGSRPDNILVAKQYRLSSNGDSLRRDSFGTIIVEEKGTSFNFSSGESNSQLWKDGQPPYDGHAQDVTRGNSIILVVIYAILSLCGLVLALFFLGFNILFRKRKVIKLTSPNLNYLIILGAILLYVCVIFYTYFPNSGRTQTVLCNVQIWLFSLGYDLCFAVILAKTWRIYYIFNRPKLQKKKKIIIKDYTLLIMIAIIVIIDLVIILIGTVIPQSRLVSSRVRDMEQPQTITDEGIIQNNYIYVCAQTNSIIWLSLSFGYKGFLQVVAIFMAFHTRRVKVKVLNESIEITAIIYINSIILVLLVVTKFTLVRYHNFYAALFGLALIVDASLFLCLIFIPKMINLYLDPEGKKIFTQEKELDDDDTPSALPANATTTFQITSDNETINNLRERIKELELKQSQKVSF